MSHISGLGFADQRQRMACPKSATPSRLEQKTAKDKDDATKLAQWRAEVRDRDEGKCRCCDMKTIKTISLHPRRGEANHVAGRDDRAVRYDTRNGIHLCLRCHERCTGKVNDKLKIVGTAWFTKAGTRYINADHKVTFQEAV